MEANFRILCPLDFSECSLNALEFATRLGEVYQAHLILYHVLNTQDYLKLTPNDPEGVHQRKFVEEKLANLLAAVEEEALGNGLASCAVQLEEGEIVTSIDAFAEQHQIDLIVIGTEGMNATRSGSMGSRASRLVGLAGKDVLVIPKAVFFKPIQRMVYTQDYLEEDKLAIQKVSRLAAIFHARVDVVHFTAKINLHSESLHLSAKEEMSPFCTYDRVEFRLEEYHTSVEKAISAYAQQENVHILFTLSEEQGFLDRLLDRSLSKKLSTALTIPLWVIKSF